MENIPLETTNNPKEFIKLTPKLFKHCILYMNLRKYTEKTKQQYLRELKSLFKNKELTQYLYVKYWGKGHAYRAILNIILKTCWFYDFPYYHYKAVNETKSNREKILNPDSERIYSEEEIISLSRKVPNGLMIECAYFIGAGLRFSSVVRIKWGDFDWENWQDKTKPGRVIIKAKGRKTAKLPVHPYLMNKLFNLALENKKIFANIPYKNFAGENYLFLDEKSIEKNIKKLKDREFNLMLDESDEANLKVDYLERAILDDANKIYDSMKYELNKYSSDFKVKRIRFHSFRKSSATNLLRKGWPLTKIKVLLMHENISTTEIYTKVNESEIGNEYDNMFNSQ